MVRRKSVVLKIKKNTELSATSTPKKSRSSSQHSTSRAGSPRKARYTPTKDKSASINTSKRRFRPGVKALREIRRLQKSTNMLIPRMPFLRVIRDILLQEQSRRALAGTPFLGLRIQGLALQALQEACELYMNQLFSDSYLCTLHAKRVTLKVEDMELARRIRGRDDPGNL